nr:N-acetyl-gamma-glutamyl-phosphate reductase [Thermoanaerobacterales bacterium]
VEESFTAYGLLDHRHTPEIEQGLTAVAGELAQVLFTPHLAPMNRGILATCYARPRTDGLTTDDVLGVLREAWEDEPFVVVTPDPPATKHTLGANSVHVTAVADARTGWVVAIAALDNLVKGASGQAVQCANLVLGLPETTGLPAVGVYP